MTLTVGSCFAGIGGIDLGLEATRGFETAWHSEVSPAANRVMAARFPDSNPLGDIASLTDGLFAPEPVDVIAGGPPCQDITKGNAYGRKGLAGIKSGLFHTYAEVVRSVSPRWLIMEQVTGLLTSGPHKGADFRTVKDAFQELGYELAVVHINSRRYVPQSRDRLIIVGSREPGAASRALLPLTQDGARHIGADGAPQRITTARAAGSPGCYRKSRRPASNTDAESWVATDYANTLTLFDVGLSRATALVVDRDGRPRILTPEEWEGCHGFPTGWTVPAGTDANRWKALGNAVSPPVAERIGHGILQAEGATL